MRNNIWNKVEEDFKRQYKKAINNCTHFSDSLKHKQFAKLADEGDEYVFKVIKDISQNENPQKLKESIIQFISSYMERNLIRLRIKKNIKIREKAQFEVLERILNTTLKDLRYQEECLNDKVLDLKKEMLVEITRISPHVVPNFLKPQTKIVQKLFIRETGLPNNWKYQKLMRIKAKQESNKDKEEVPLINQRLPKNLTLQKQKQPEEPQPGTSRQYNDNVATNPPFRNMTLQDKLKRARQIAEKREAERLSRSQNKDSSSKDNESR